MPQEKRARASPEAGGTPPKQQQSKPAPRAAVAAMPVVGDLLEAIYAEGCWVPARAIGVRSRQVHVEFELPEPEPPRALLEAAHYFCEEDDTPKEVSRRFGVPVAAVLALNASRLEGLVSTSRLRRRTILALPLVHAVAENETPRAAAAALGLECDSLVAANGALDAELGPLGPATRLPADTQLLLPAGAPPPQYSARPMPLLASRVELAGWCAGEGWRVAEVRRLLGGARFVAVAAEEAKEEELRLRDEGKTWRWPDGARPRGGGERARSGGEGRAAAVGEVVDVEVEEGGATRWRAAEVRELLGEGRFRVCVDGDEDFVEEYGPDEEGSEWRWPPQGRSRATEWVAAGFTRPRPPRAPTNFLAAAAGGGTVQVLQDGGWWQAAIADGRLLLGHQQ